MAVAPEIIYKFQDIHNGKDMTPFGQGTPTVGVTYGDWTGVAGDVVSKKANCRVTVKYSKVKWTINPNNSVTISGKVTATLVRTATDEESVCHQEVTAWFGDPESVVFYSDTIPSGGSGTYTLIPAAQQDFSFTIPPSDNPQEYVFGALHFKNWCYEKTGVYDPAQFPPDEFRVGMFVKNLNPPAYIPGKVLDNGGLWQSHNRVTDGTAKVLAKNGSWNVMTTENGAVGQGNPPTIMTNAAFFNMRKIGENA